MVNLCLMVKYVVKTFWEIYVVSQNSHLLEKVYRCNRIKSVADEIEGNSSLYQSSHTHWISYGAVFWTFILYTHTHIFSGWLKKLHQKMG